MYKGSSQKPPFQKGRILANHSLTVLNRAIYYLWPWLITMSTEVFHKKHRGRDFSLIWFESQYLVVFTINEQIGKKLKSKNPSQQTLPPHPHYKTITLKLGKPGCDPDPPLIIGVNLKFNL